MGVFERYRNRRSDLVIPNYIDEKEPGVWCEFVKHCDAPVSNYLWLRAGNRLEIVSGLKYSHHDSGPGSSWAKGPKGKIRMVRALWKRLNNVH